MQALRCNVTHVFRACQCVWWGMCRWRQVGVLFYRNFQLIQRIYRLHVLPPGLLAVAFICYPYVLPSLSATRYPPPPLALSPHPPMRIARRMVGNHRSAAVPPSIPLRPRRSPHPLRTFLHRPNLPFLCSNTPVA